MPEEPICKNLWFYCIAKYIKDTTLEQIQGQLTHKKLGACSDRVKLGRIK